MPVRVSWSLGFLIRIFVFKHGLICLRSNLYNILCFPLFSNVNSLSIRFFNRFYRWFVLNKYSKLLRRIAWEIFRRIKSLGWFCYFGSNKLTISCWWRTMKVLDLWRRRYLTFKISGVRAIKNFLFYTWINNYSGSAFLSFLIHLFTWS